MKKQKSFIRETLETVGSSIVIVVLLLEFFIFPCQVDGSSMLNTLHDKDLGFSFVITKNIGVNRFDIVVINTNDDAKKIVKRVIGLPFDTIEYKDNVLYINGNRYEEDFLSDVITQDLSITLGEDEYYCLGDNRNNSKDSRYYGPFSKKDFVSTHMFIIYPFNNFGFEK